jgi:AraC-like DNA-binding protein
LSRHLNSSLEQIFSEISSHAEPDNRILRNLFENWLLDMARESGGAATRLPLAAMARIAGLSPSHLSAEFRRNFEVPPGVYLIRRRMDEARYLLRHRNLAIAEVAGQVGYPDIFQFSRMFRRVVGTSPGAYRRGGAGDVAGA